MLIGIVRAKRRGLVRSLPPARGQAPPSAAQEEDRSEFRDFHHHWNKIPAAFATVKLRPRSGYLAAMARVLLSPWRMID
jgi:hypothetical protein